MFTTTVAAAALQASQSSSTTFPQHLTADPLIWSLCVPLFSLASGCEADTKAAAGEMRQEQESKERTGERERDTHAPLIILPDETDTLTHTRSERERETQDFLTTFCHPMPSWPSQSSPSASLSPVVPSSFQSPNLPPSFPPLTSVCRESRCLWFPGGMMSPACLSCVFLPTLDAAGVPVSPGDRDGGVDESESACVSGSKNFRLFWPFLPPVSSSPALVCASASD